MADNQVKGFTPSHLTYSLFQDILAGVNKTATLVSWSRVELKNDHGVMSNSGKMSKQNGSESITETNPEYSGPNNKCSNSKRLTGIMAFKLNYRLQGNRKIHQKTVILKSKATGEEILSNMFRLAEGLDKKLYETWCEYLQIRVKETVSIVEIEFVRTEDPSFKSIMPDVYWSNIDESNGIYVFAMEYFDPDTFSYIDTSNKVNMWKEADIMEVLQGLARFHARYYGSGLSDIPKSLKIYLYRQDKKYLMDLMYLCKSVLKCNTHSLQSELNYKNYSTLEKVIANFDYVADVIDQSPMTLIHNDFSLRNFCLRKEIPPGKLQACVYDWEMACIGAPQYDLAECLIYFLHHNSSLDEWNKYIEQYLVYFKGEFVKSHKEPPIMQKYLQIEDFRKVFDMSIMAVITTRYVTLYSVLYKKFKFTWLRNTLLTGVGYIEKVLHRYSFVD